MSVNLSAFISFKHQNITVQIMHSKQQIEILFHMLKKNQQHVQKLDM
jgi:hypothetical protein